MRRLIWKYFVLPSAALSFGSILWAMVIVTFPTASASVDSVSTKKGNVQAPTISKENQKSTWDTLQDLFRKKPRRGGSRGDFCSIWPNGDDPDLLVIWSDKPLFIWKGSVKRIAVRLPSGESDLWSHDVTKNEQSALYTGPALQSGEEYDYWVMYETTYKGKTTTNTKYIPFKIMEMEKRSQIKDELAVLKNKNQSLDAEEIVLQRAKYFAGRKFWSDFLQEVFSVENPSSEWNRETEQIRSQLCPTKVQSEGSTSQGS